MPDAGAPGGLADAVAREFVATARRLLTVEYRTKLAHALDVLPADALWRRPAEGSNAVGNLLLHLAGNVRQWLVAGIGGVAFDRDRSGEFAAEGGRDAPALLAHLDAALRDADAVLATLGPGDLVRPVRIQSRDTTVLAAVFHVTEHFGMHTGQVLLLTKAAAPGRLRLYEDEPTGQARPLWQAALRPVPGLGSA